jgi:type IV pilus biogenesis protein PilP
VPKAALPVGAKTPESRPSTSLPETDRTSPRSLGRLFDLKRQEALLKREIAVKKLKDELSGKPGSKSLKTPSKGSPVTLLAAGLPGHRYAVLAWPDGRRIRVRQGETLPDGEHVERIDGSGVTIKKRGAVVIYPFGEAGRGRSGSFPSMFQGNSFVPPPVPNGVPYR